MEVTIVEGDLLDQTTESIVNPWNRNIIPWWLLIPHGVSGAIKKRAGLQPFMQLGKMGPIPLGQAVVTEPGKLPFKCLIHVASIDPFWRASEKSIQDSVINAMKLASEQGLKSIAFPILGAGSGGFNSEQAETIMIRTFERLNWNIEVLIVRYN